MSVRHMRFWGWGFEDQPIDEDEAQLFVGHVLKRLSAEGLTPDPSPKLDEISLNAPRLKIPDSLSAIATSDVADRVAHTYGKSFPDYLRALARDFAVAPDVVAYPRDEADIIALLDWANDAGAAAIPFGGGSSVVGGVEPAVGDGYAGTLTLDMRHLDKVLEVDVPSRAARIQAGVLGPAMEAQLKPHGYSLRHFPQSFEYSSLGGWIATRAGGHFASLYTHIDDFVESLRVVTPAGMLESFRLPGSGAGPSPDRLFIGSEGILGIVTEAWMRLQDRPTFRASATVWFDDFYRAARAVRAVSQAGLYPSNCRLVDAEEAAMSRAGDGSRHMLVLAFESADHPVEAWMARAVECCRDHGGDVDTGDAEEAHRDGAAGAWRTAFIRSPYYRDRLIARGVIHDTYETAITWDRFEDFHATLMDTTRQAVERATGAPGKVTCRFTHIYPDGPAPYFTFHGIGRKGALMEQWRDIKEASSEKLNALGGTITHHHAVGRDHRPWYDKQRPDLFAAALGAAKKALDPNGILNPGVLIDPQRDGRHRGDDNR